MLNLKFVRPVGGESSIYPRYAADDAIVHSIVRWCEEILLAGNRFSLKIDKTAIFQLPSTVLNTHGYLVSVDSPETIKAILGKAKKLQAGLEREIGTKISELNVCGGVLVLSRTIYHDPKPKGENQYNAKRFTVRDRYWLDVYIRRTVRPHVEVAFPILRIYPDSVGAYYYRPVAKNEIETFYNNLVEYFPEPDDLVVTWHELAQILGLDHSRLYLQACFSGTSYPRVFFGTHDQGDDSWLHPPSAPPGEAVRTPIYGLEFLPGMGTNLIGGWGGSPGYTQPALTDPQFALPDVEFGRKFGELSIFNQYIGTLDEAGNISSWSLVPATQPYLLPQTGLQLRYTHDKLVGPPKPPLPNDLFGQAAVKLLTQASGGWTTYAGGGYFLTKANGLKQLAAGTGNWGSAEAASVLVVIGVAEAAPQALAGLSAAVAVGAGIYKRIYEKEMSREVERCYQNYTGADCIACVEGTQAYKVNQVEEYASYLAFGAAVLTIVIAAAATPIGIAGIIVGALSAGGAIFGFIDQLKDDKNLREPCKTFV